jgi:hypothetical protein
MEVPLRIVGFKLHYHHARMSIEFAKFALRSYLNISPYTLLTKLSMIPNLALGYACVIIGYLLLLARIDLKTGLLFDRDKERHQRHLYMILCAYV